MVSLIGNSSYFVNLERNMILSRLSFNGLISYNLYTKALSHDTKSYKVLDNNPYGISYQKPTIKF